MSVEPLTAEQADEIHTKYGGTNVPAYRAILRIASGAHTVIESAKLAALKSGNGWRCFHCDETFTNYVEARNHFGWTPADGAPVCRVDGGTAREIYRLKRVEELLRKEIAELKDAARKSGGGA